MSMWARLKSLAGGRAPLTSVASAATLRVGDEDGAIVVTGTTTVTSLVSANYIRNRQLTIIGGVGANVTFTNTNTLTTAGQMYLHGANRQLVESDVMVLICQADGTWILVSTTTV